MTDQIAGFICYSHADFEFFRIEEIVNILEHDPDINEIFYSLDTHIANFISYMNESLEQAQFVLLFCTQRSKNSRFVEMEWGAAIASGKPIIPIFQNPDDIPTLLKASTGVQYTPEDFESFLNDLYKTIQKKVLHRSRFKIRALSNIYNSKKVASKEAVVELESNNSVEDIHSQQQISIKPPEHHYKKPPSRKIKKRNNYKLIPQLREDCIIEGKEKWISKYEKGDIIFLISSDPLKSYSIITKIEGKRISEEPRILVDKRILGKFGENDEVFILPYNPAEAIEIQICISEEYSMLSSGDWTSNIKPSIKDKLIDLGQEISFLIPWEGGGAPIVGSGIINHTLPNPPIYISDRTKIYLDKKDQQEIIEIKQQKMEEQEKRVYILLKQLDYDTLKTIKSIKVGNFPTIGNKYTFQKTNPQKLFDSIRMVFKNLDELENPYEQTYDSEEQDYFSSAVYLLEEADIIQIIDIQIISSENSGSLIIWLTGKDKHLMQKTLERYHSRIIKLKEGLEEKVEVMSQNCPECGGDLPIENIDVNGMVECEFCGKISRIPKALRY
jgi:hypothetical protein